MKTQNAFLLTLYQQPQTVFSLSEIGILQRAVNRANLKSQINYHVKTGALLNPRRGIYAKPNYSHLELGGKLFKPSYISLQTVLQKTGVIFQDYQTIFLVSYLTREIEVKGQKFSYRKIKDEILTNTQGIKQENGYWIAEKERAITDMMYLFGDYHFDNVQGVDWDKIFVIVKIYQEKQMEKRVEKLYKYK